MQIQEGRIGPLYCRDVALPVEGRAAELGVVLCHGYGAPGTDLVMLGDALFQERPELAGRVRFLFPEAPVSLADQGMPGGRAWWPLNIQRLQAQLQAGSVDELRTVAPPGLDAARDALRTTLDAWRQEQGWDWSQLVIGGFSQGAMVSCETVAALSTSPAGLVALSGMLIHEPAWRTGLQAKPGLPVFQSHGQYDVVLPYVSGVWLKDLLTEAGADLQFVPFPGGHQIPWEVLESLGDFLTARLPPQESH